METMQDFCPRSRTRRTGSSRVSALLYPLLGACFWASVSGYKPVIIVHGLFDSSEDFKNLKLFINQVSRATMWTWFGRIALGVGLWTKGC